MLAKSLMYFSRSIAERIASESSLTRPQRSIFRGRSRRRRTSILPGFLTHAGHSYDVRTKEEILEIARHERDVMVELAERLRSDGIDVPCVSIGSTPTMTHVDNLDGIDEIRPGNYIFFDGYQATLGSCAFDDTALTVLTAVIHKDASRRKLVVDAGAIALSKDRGPTHLDPACGYGHVLDIEGSETGMRVTGMSQEHGEIVAGDSPAFDRIKVGDRLRILANHSCLTAAQHSYLQRRREQ